MEIKINTKFNLKENVFFIDNNKIKHAYIRRISIDADIVMTSTMELRIRPQTTYFLREDNWLGNKMLDKKEEELFATIEELIEHIKNK